MPASCRRSITSSFAETLSVCLGDFQERMMASFERELDKVTILEPSANGDKETKLFDNKLDVKFAHRRHRRSISSPEVMRPWTLNALQSARRELDAQSAMSTEDANKLEQMSMSALSVVSYPPPLSVPVSVVPQEPLAVQRADSFQSVGSGLTLQHALRQRESSHSGLSRSSPSNMSNISEKPPTPTPAMTPRLPSKVSTFDQSPRGRGKRGGGYVRERRGSCCSMLGMPNMNLNVVTNGALNDSTDHHSAGAFEVLSQWSTNDAAKRSLKRFTSMGSDEINRYDNDDDETECEGLVRNGTFLEQFVVLPKSLKRIAWDVLGMLLIAFDMVWLPLQVFDLESSAFTNTIAWISRLFWTCDVGANFFTGVLRSNGEIELRLQQIALHRAATWLPLDICLVTVDWVEIMQANADGANASTVGKTMRVVRLLRMLRLLRLIKAPSLLAKMFENIHSEKLILILKISKITVSIIFLVHVIACLWFWLGASADTGWVRYSNLLDATPSAQYGLAFHWSLTQFTGAMDLQPHNLEERYFAICVLMLAFLTTASFLSSMTSSMTQLQIILSRESEQFVVLRRYLAARGISQKLSSRVSRNARHGFKERQRQVPEDDVEVLALVSEPLRVEVHFEIHSPLLLEHPLFAKLMDMSPMVIRRIAHTAIHEIPLSAGDWVFNAGELPATPSVLFIASGSLQYFFQMQELDKRQSGCITSLIAERGNWLCEAILWTHWIFLGTLRATCDCRIMMLGVAELNNIIMRTPQLKPTLMSYAEAYVASLNKNRHFYSDFGDKQATAQLVRRCFDILSESESENTPRSSRSWAPQLPQQVE
eukprot:TRINITY_DN20407_c0_g1_i1.p1 TRINITY_DN20407_c0_g1~~TRINITY_DN20407_c0_g1_i1.p1  ORF type:complete len:824 (+),score=145.55 TRINITY_DN20407_c0_g1_i1:187-2658(+)